MPFVAVMKLLLEDGAMKIYHILKQDPGDLRCSEEMEVACEITSVCRRKQHCMFTRGQRFSRLIELIGSVLLADNEDISGSSRWTVEAAL